MAPTAALRPEWFTAMIMARSKSSWLTRQAYTAPATTWAALSQWIRSIMSAGFKPSISEKVTAWRIMFARSKAWLYWWPN